MGALPKKYAAMFHASQEEVRKALSPYLARCCGQYFDKTSAIETFTVYSKEVDAYDNRHRLRGIVTVWYGYPFRGDKYCNVNISFDAGMMKWQAGTFEETLANAIPALPPES